LSRLDDEQSGRVKLEALHTPVPPDRLAQARSTAKALGAAIYDKFPWFPGARPMQDEPAELIFNRTWRPTVSITGAEGRPRFLIAGVTGPQSNAHGPTEFLHVPTGKRLTSCVAQVIADHASRR